MSTENSFSKQVDDVLNGSFPFYSALKVCDTPQILLDVGCEQLPMLYTQKHLKNAIKSNSNKQHFHGLDIEQIKKLPELIENPTMVYDSLSRNDSIVMVTTEFDKSNNPIVVSVKPNGMGKYELETMESNFITSVHGRENFIQQIKNAAEQDKILFCDKEKSQEMFERWGLQLSELTNTLDFNIIIHKSNNIVNRVSEKTDDRFKKYEDIDYKVVHMSLSDAVSAVENEKVQDNLLFSVISFSNDNNTTRFMSAEPFEFDLEERYLEYLELANLSVGDKVTIEKKIYCTSPDNEITSLREATGFELTDIKLNLSDVLTKSQKMSEDSKDVIVSEESLKKNQNNEYGTFSIYQLENRHPSTFEPYDRLKAEPNIDDYRFIYLSNLESGTSLENIYYRFNQEHPADYRGRPLSVSDVVVTNIAGEKKAYYCDRFGFKELENSFFNHKNLSNSDEIDKLINQIDTNSKKTKKI